MAPTLLTFILTASFDRSTRGWLDDDSLQALQATLIEDPEAGDVIKGAGGVRKVRVALPGRGKRGSARVVYLYRSAKGLIYLMLGYQKNTQANLTPAQTKALRMIVQQLEDE